MLHDNDLGGEVSNTYWWAVGGVSPNFSSLEVSLLNSLKLETYIVSWEGFLDGGVMHLYGLALSVESSWGGGELHTWLKDTSLNSSGGDETYSLNL